MKSQDHAGIKNSHVGITRDQLPDDPSAPGSRRDQGWDQAVNAGGIRAFTLFDPEIPKNHVIVKQSEKEQAHA
ncbi:MAG: hypothetical protein K5746_08910 [Clostridiales bacterium]|nr:hypothetical protein [Clostridiales bacterium]